MDFMEQKRKKEGEAMQTGCGAIETYISRAKKDDPVLARLRERLENMLEHINIIQPDKKRSLMKTFPGRNFVRVQNTSPVREEVNSR